MARKSVVRGVRTSLDEEHRQMVRRRDRKLKRGPCEICGEPGQLHHVDYHDPARTMVLCKTHHGAYESQFDKPAPLDWMADIRAAQRRIDAQRLQARRSRAAPSSD